MCLYLCVHIHTYVCRYADRWNHKMVKIGRGRWKSSDIVSLLKKVHLKQVAQEDAQVSFENLPGGDSIVSSNNLFQRKLLYYVKKCFLVFRWNCLGSSICPLPLLLSLVSTQKSLLHLSCNLLQVFIPTDEIFLSLLFSR